MLETKNLLERVCEKLKDRGYDVRISKFYKNNRAVKGMAFYLDSENEGLHIDFEDEPDRKVGAKASMIFYEETLQDIVENSGICWFDELCDEVVKVRKAASNAIMDYSNCYEHLRESDYILEKVILGICKADWNERMLDDIPHYIIPETDLAIYLRINMGEYGSLRLSESILKDAGVEKNEVFDAARKNVMEKRSVEEPWPGLVLVSNDDKIYGASLLGCDGVLDEVLKHLACESIVIIPSSTHEFLAMKSDMVDTKEINFMIKEVNMNFVRIEDRLSDHAYFYDGKQLKML